MTQGLNEIRLRFRRFCEEHIVPHAADFDREGALSPALLRQMATDGLMGLTVAREFGGGGEDMVSYGLLHEEFGRVCGSTRSLLTVHEMVCHAIERWGSRSQKQRWLAPLATGRILGAFAASEADAGSDLSSVTAVARERQGACILSGCKKWISFGQIADVFLVLVRCDGGLATFLVERSAPGLTVQPISPVTGLRASMLAALCFDNVEVPLENMVGRQGFGLSHVASSALLHGRYSVAWSCVGIAQECLGLAMEASTNRVQFGSCLSDFQLVKRMVADMAARTQAARLLCLNSGYLIDEADPDAVLQTMTAKYFASQTAAKATHDAVQIHGARGLCTEAAVNRLWRDARVMEIIEGSTELLQVMIADSHYASQTKISAAKEERWAAQ